MKRKFQPPPGVTFFTLLTFATLVGLGAWQMKRMEWKTTLLTQIETRMQKQHVPMPEKIDDPSGWEYRRVTLAGRFLYDHEFLIKPRTLDGLSGYHMLVPFQRASGGVVMVNRGWISDALIPQASRPKGLLQIEGIVQLAHLTSFTPPNKPEKNDWYWADIRAMAEATQLKNLAPVLVNIVNKEPGVYPVGGKVARHIRNNHKQYAVFWFMMALILQAIFVIRYWQREDTACLDTSAHGVRPSA